MHLQTHLLLSWSVGHKLTERRDRVVVTFSGVLPDLDALSALWSQQAYSTWHHVLTHNITTALILTLGAALIARRKLSTAILTLVAYHLHLVCDLLGSGVNWSIAYLYPFSNRFFPTPFGWELASWQNVLITLLAIFFGFYTAIKYQRTFVESFAPKKVDQAIVQAIRQRFINKLR